MRKIIPTKRWLIIPFLLVGGGAIVLLTHWTDAWLEDSRRGASPEFVSGPWGQLQIKNISVRQPVEYVGFDQTSADGPYWNFGALTGPAVRSLLLEAGCSQELADHLLASQVPASGMDTVIKPDHESILALSPDVRSKLYLLLAKNPANRLQANPYFIREGDVENLFYKDELPTDGRVISMMKKLLYQRNGFTYFSDPEVVLSLISSEEERVKYLQSLTTIRVVLMGLRIRPDADIDKPLNYWVFSLPGVKLKDIQPLFEGLKNEAFGGVLSILYLLPPLAREKLLTSPMPPKGKDILPDCHWSALNYFSADPDPRMSDNDFASKYIQDHYYQIARPGIPGDLVLLLDQENRVIHSSVYLAADVVFTKNGINYAQPWVLMHEKDMIGRFSALEPVKEAYFRDRQN